MRFKEVTLDFLKHTTHHPEAPKRSAFVQQCYRWRTGKEGGVITHKGKILAFVMKELPEGVPQDEVGQDNFNKSKLTLVQFKAWEKFDVVKCLICTRIAFWLINPRHGELVQLPEVDFDEE